ncbi:MAG TPA: hypothetical protein VK829_11330 [Terriglobales bacterium]|jgi:hypothetical protein|nr:hypothetical protein [Terriglobales bacterium]
MTHSSRRTRTTTDLSDSARRQLNMYALAAGAAGVSLLAVSQPAQGKIVYTPADKWLPVNQNFYIDLNNDRVPDFTFQLYAQQSNSGWVDGLNVGGADGNAVWKTSTQFYQCAAALPKGTKVGAASPFQKGHLRMFLDGDNIYGGFSFCPWRYVGTEAYLGLKFKINGQIHYGWARFGQIITNEPRARLTGYAYETVPGKAIITGATKGPGDDEQTASFKTHAPQPAALGILALGSPGLSIWKRESVPARTQRNWFLRNPFLA